VKFIPDKYRNTYRHWMETVKDWCISRQLWWGQRIPAYYLPDGSYVVESTPEKALEAARKINPSLTAADLQQDEDVLDTWFSSWLWPISVFDPQMPGQPDHEPNADLKYYYPTSDLVTGPDIIFFWVARMIMAGNEYMKEEPFRNVYFTGIVRDKLGRKMSKTLGNSPDPLDLIAKYGADAVRLGMLLCSSAGNDILYDESQVEQGRNFAGKIWNAFRLINGWNVDAAAAQKPSSAVAVKWFDNLLSQAVVTVNDHFAKFRISDALMTVYKLFWDDFCAVYLEAIKPSFGEGIDQATLDSTKSFFEALLKMIHPIMPFITEELWQNLAPREEGQTIMNQPYPVAGEVDADFIAKFQMAVEAVAGVRNIRQEKAIAMKESLNVKVDENFPMEVAPVVGKLANVTVEQAAAEGTGAAFMVGTCKLFVALEGLLNVEEEIAKLEADLKYYTGFLKSVRGKLSNERFVANAPEAVVAAERKKEADALSKIETIEASLKSLR
ncbi:MAG: class I tRNA ligase family protein, partial [Bacteroidales bacterium]|nr:class I tRNA ligase family protein [Bacteroidales bacterium]